MGTKKRNKCSCLDKINIRRLMVTIQNVIAKFLEKFIFEVPDEHFSRMVGASIKEYTQSLENRKVIQDYDTRVYPKVMTWRKLYPSIWKRTLAKFGKYLSIKVDWFHLTSDKMSILHFIFPFKRELYVDTHEFDLMRDWLIFNNPVEYDKSEYMSYWEDTKQIRELDIDNKYSEWYCTEWLPDHPPTPKYVAILRSPYKYINVDMSIKPVRVIKGIKLNFTINNEGVKVL